ncbi:formate dehydrogenase subunit delta [Bosea psychrotolerans]|uniref:Formate dehydrogenase subunit delta n=1 Tax=Bosea psychrotolerans TaxID=1871628 RepID=A0A2S4MB66_9HYPH|nr:formate dehydrogenase subunit delta [Bosea psychrotolerans]POR51983.1 formate dehydrogenase subunit delta [Bosea psychrotolerans]
MSEAVLPTNEVQAAHKAEQREKLARMAGQIADFFKSYPDAQAVPAIADHINQFWSRRMREDFLAAFNGDSQELHPLVRRALALIRPARGG